MKVYMIHIYKTKTAAEKRAAREVWDDYVGLNFRVVLVEGGFAVVRDFEESDERWGRPGAIMELCV